MADQSDSSGTPSKPAANGGGGAAAGGNRGGSGGAGSGGGQNRNRNRNRSRSRNRSSGGGRAAGGGGRSSSGQRKGQSQGQGQRSGNRSRSGSQSHGGRQRAPVALAPPPPPLPPLDVTPSLGAPQVYPGEVAANRRRAVRLCAYTAVVPALLMFALLSVAVSIIAGVIALVVVGAACMYAVWHLAPAIALRRIGAVPLEEHDDPRLTNVTEGLCATFGLSMPTFHLLDDDVPNACALGRDASRSDIVVTTGLLELLDPIELEGVIAHELAHVKRGDNGVSCVGITLATLFGGEKTLRGCVGANREYRADVVGASTVRYPRGLLDALRTMERAPAPAEGSFFASPSRFGPTRWVWIDPSVGRRDEALVPGDLNATSVRAAALSEW